MSEGPHPPPDRPSDASSPKSPRREVRFAQARSLGILFVLVALLALVVYNTLAEGSPWVNRDRDVRLLITLLSLLLGVDMLIGNRHEIAGLVGRVLIEYAATNQRATDRRGHTAYGRQTQRPLPPDWDADDDPQNARERYYDQHHPPPPPRRGRDADRDGDGCDATGDTERDTESNES